MGYGSSEEVNQVRRFFVTGASGFLGSALVPALKGPVVALVRDRAIHVAAGVNPDSFLPAHATVCFGDLSDIAVLERIMAEYKIDTVVHLAAQTEVGVGVENPVGTFKANIEGTWNLLEACRRQRVARVVVAASDKAYGRTPPPYREGQPLEPDRPYETSKACTDLIARTYSSTYNMSIAVTRCVNLYGPGCLTLSTLVPNTIRRILKGQVPIVRNGGQMQRDWLYIEDAVDAYLKLIDSDYVGSMNFGGGRGVPVIEITKTIMEIMDWDGGFYDEPDTLGEIVNQWADSSLAYTVLGWQPKHTLEEGLRKSVEWYRRYLTEK